MAGEQRAGLDAGGRGADSPREWVKPQVHDMLAGAAELGGDTNVDGDPGFS